MRTIRRIGAHRPVSELCNRVQRITCLGFEDAYNLVIGLLRVRSMLVISDRALFTNRQCARQWNIGIVDSEVPERIHPQGAAKMLPNIEACLPAAPLFRLI